MHGVEDDRMWDVSSTEPKKPSSFFQQREGDLRYF